MQLDALSLAASVRINVTLGRGQPGAAHGLQRGHSQGRRQPSPSVWLLLTTFSLCSLSCYGTDGTVDTQLNAGEHTAVLPLRRTVNNEPVFVFAWY